jgi:ferritin-like metal-binding protein YciE
MRQKDAAERCGTKCQYTESQKVPGAEAHFSETILIDRKGQVMTATKQNTLQELFLGELKDMYDAEKQLVKALPKLAKMASNPDLRNGIEEHLEQTKGHVSRIEEVFDLMGTKHQSKKCAGIQGILAEGNETLGAMEGNALDAALIASAQKVEHYEIASYGSLYSWANLLGHDDAAILLQRTLDEEKAADRKLSELAVESVNAQAI